MGNVMMIRKTERMVRSTAQSPSPSLSSSLVFLDHLDAHEKGDGECDDDQEDREDGQKHSTESITLSILLSHWPSWPLPISIASSLLKQTLNSAYFLHACHQPHSFNFS